MDRQTVVQVFVRTPSTNQWTLAPAYDLTAALPDGFPQHQRVPCLKDLDDLQLLMLAAKDFQMDTAHALELLAQLVFSTVRPRGLVVVLQCFQTSSTPALLLNSSTRRQMALSTSAWTPAQPVSWLAGIRYLPDSDQSNRISIGTSG